MSKRFGILVLTGAAGLFLSLASPAPSKAAEERPLAARDLVTAAYMHEASLSPDAEWVAYVLRKADMEKNRTEHQIYLVPRRDGEPRPVTHGGESAREPQWSPRGRYLSFLRSASSDKGKDPSDDDEKQVWALSMEGGEPFQLTEIQGGVLQHEWSPNGRSIIVLAPEEKSEALREYVEEREEKGFDTQARGKDIPQKLLWRYPVPKGKRELLFRGDPGMDTFTTSPDGESIAFRSNKTGLDADDETFDVYLLDLSSKKARQVTRRLGEEDDIHWTHDGRGLIVTATKIDTLDFSQREVFTIPLDTNLGGDPVPSNRWVPWTDRFDREVDQLLWPKSSGDTYVIAYDGVSRRLAMLDHAGRAEWLTDDDEIVMTGAISRDGRWMALTMESPDYPPRLVLVDRDGDVKRVLADPNKEVFRSIRPAEQEVLRWTSRDGLPVEGILTYPWWKDAHPPYPLIVYAHGGPNWHVADRLVHELQVWAGWGYMVLAPNYRGSTGYGNDFATANLRDLGGGDLDDVLTGVDHLIEQGLADPKRLAIMGGSYGGYLTNRAISRTNRFAAAVSEYGIFSLITDFSNTIYPQWEKSYLREYYWENLEPYLEMSPAFEADLITTPVLILHGEEDENTFIANSLEMYTALNRLGRTVELHTFPREPHGFYEPNHILQEMHLIQGWLDRHVTGGALWPPQYSDLMDVLPEHLPPSLSEQLRGLDKLPRLYRPGDTLRVERGTPMAAMVTSVECPESYGPEKPEGRFVTVSLLFSASGEAATRFQLRSEDIALLVPTGRSHHPVGIPQKVHGKTSLVRSQDFVFRLSVEEGEDVRWLPLTITFDIPKDRHTLPLIVGPFPPVLLSVGEAAVRD